MAKKSSKRGGATLSEVAQAAGVSKMTASRVLRNANGFTEETKAKVMLQVERLGYVPNRIAAAFGSFDTSTLIGVSVPSLTSGLYGPVLDSIDRTFLKYGYQTMIGAHERSPETEEEWLRAILAWRPAGVILSGRKHTPATVEILKAQAIPIVEMWNLNTSPLDISVGFNHFDCGYEMGQFMLSKGYKKIAYIGANRNEGSTNLIRLDGFQAALDDSSLQMVSKEILVDHAGFYPGYYGTENVLNRTSDVDAIYYQDDTMAVGGMFYCQKHGIEIPNDIAIAGWGGMEITSVLPRKLTTTTVATETLGKSAAEALVARIRNEPTKDVNVVETRLIPGETV
ncbi:MAG: LacI family DNA-binding transcriptional regulator [Lentilitoribacter sp.]